MRRSPFFNGIGKLMASRPKCRSTAKTKRHFPMMTTWRSLKTQGYLRKNIKVLVFDRTAKIERCPRDAQLQCDFVVSFDDTNAGIEDVEEEYLKMLRADLGYSFAGFSPVHNSDKEQIHFNLAFATNHPMGMETMRTAEFKALSDYGCTRFNKKQPPQDDLFGSIGEQLDVGGPYLRTREGHRMRADDEVLRLIVENPEGLKFDRLSALAQQSLYLRRTELKEILVEPTSRGNISADWKVGRKQKPRDPDITRSA